MPAELSDVEIEKIRNRLNETETAYPFPEGEKRRLDARRWVLSKVEPGGIGAEIGVFRGHFSEMICKIAKPRKLYLIDPWTTTGDLFGWGGEYTANNTLPTAVARDEAALRTSLYPRTETVIIEGMFPNCSNQISEKLDWVYLDASHHYQATLLELRALKTMLKPGGAILGDDWIGDPKHKHFGVMQACHTFMRETDFDLVAAGLGHQWCMKQLRLQAPLD